MGTKWAIAWCRNTSVAANFAFYGNGSSANGYYYLNGFENVISSYVTLFELTVINNWYILMEGYAATVNEWSRIYFMLFYLTIMMLLSIVVASVLDGFMFRISYKEQMSQEDGESKYFFIFKKNKFIFWIVLQQKNGWWRKRSR